MIPYFAVHCMKAACGKKNNEELDMIILGHRGVVEGSVWIVEII